MEKFTTDGIVIKTNATAEADLTVSVLTRRRGVIRAFAKGARSTKSRLHGVGLFAYCDFTMNEKNGIYYINEAVVKDLFFNLRSDLKALTVAQYFCEIVLKTLPDGAEEPEFLRLMLNSLHLLAKQKKPILLVKSVFELRCLCLLGYMPNVIACVNCGAFQTDVMYFNCATGELLCRDCGDNNRFLPVPLSVISAVRHIVFSESEKCFSFELPREPLALLNRLTESYVENCFHRKFALLDYFYRD